MIPPLVGYLGWKRFERSGAGQGHMRPVVVVVTLAGRQDPAEVGQVPDEDAVEKLPIHRSMIEFMRGIRTPLRTIPGPLR